MKKDFLTFRRVALLLAGASAMTMLSACDMMENMHNPFSDGRKEQQVVGGRRAPLLNQGYGTQPALPPGVTPPPSTGNPYDAYDASGNPVAPPPSAPPAMPPQPYKSSADTNPYDYYDASGNPVAPKATAADKAAGTPSQSGFFDRLFGNGSGEPAQAPKDDAVRKPLPGNPYYSNETVPVAPIPPGPQSSLPPGPAITPLLAPPPAYSDAPKEPGAADEPIPPRIFSENDEPREDVSLSATSPSAAAVVVAEEEPAASGPSWLDRVLGRKKNLNPSDQAALDAPYPELSSVPPRPAEFQVVQQEKQQRMEELQSDHMQAAEAKQALDGEPSQQQPTVAPVDVTPSAAQAEAVPAPQENPTEKPAEPVLLGHVSTLPQPVTEPAETKTVIQETAPAPVAATLAQAKPEEAPPASAQEKPERPYWWQGWGAFSRHKDAATASDDAEETADTVAVQPPAPEAAESVAASPEPAPLADVTPLVAPPPPAAALPAYVPAPAPVAAAEEPADKETGGDKADNALPSPQLLETVKMLPPSRYMMRQQAAQPRAAEY